MNNNKTFAMFMLILVGIAALVIRNLKRSSWGRAIAATRSSEVAANTSGVSVLRVKLGVFAISAAIAGFGGIFYASFQQSITNQSVVVTTGLLWLATVVLFGIRRTAAAVLAGIVSAASPVIFSSGIHFPDPLTFLNWDGTRSAEIPAILFGLGAVQLARYPDGVISITAMQNYARRVKRRAKRAAALGVPATEIDAVVLQEDAAIEVETERMRRELLAEGAIHEDVVVPEPVGDVVLSLQGLHAGYEAVEVLHGIDFTVRRGEITVLLGANGSGKSTLCSTISGVVPVRSGAIELRGVDVSSMPAYKRARSGVLVAPESRGIFPGLTVEENLMLRLPKAEDRNEVYDRFPVLAERRRLPSGSLSGGEQQMLTLSPVLVNPPELLVADEPTLGLAPMIVAELMGVFQELRDRNVAILLVEEKARDVLQIAERVAFLELGHLVWVGPRADIDDERLVATYLGGGSD
jgi:ABC-type branched-subunit amino acid transport system ATPase component